MRTYEEKTLKDLMIIEKFDKLGNPYCEFTKEGKKILLAFLLLWPFNWLFRLINLFKR